jgi:hypothetical protein
VIGLGVGVMLTPSVNVVQSAFPEELQGEISGLSRSVSNLGSSLGAAVAGTILDSSLGDKSDDRPGMHRDRRARCRDVPSCPAWSGGRVALDCVKL